jgi:hypothetical protein
MTSAEEEEEEATMERSATGFRRAQAEGHRRREGRRTLEEDLEDTPGLLVDEARDPLDTATACQTADRRLGDALDVVTQDLPGSIGRESHGVSRAAANDQRGPTMRSTTRKGGGPHLAVTLGAALAESLASLSAARHSC